MIYVSEKDPLRYQDPRGIQITGYGYGGIHVHAHLYLSFGLLSVSRRSKDMEEMYSQDHNVAVVICRGVI